MESAASELIKWATALGLVKKADEAPKSRITEQDRAIAVRIYLGRGW